jgi:hypothetical protein
MAKLPLALVAFSVALCGYASAETITSEAAVSAADQACSASWGESFRKSGKAWKIQPSDWHTRFVEGYWKTWVGSESDPQFLVNVPADGSPLVPGKSCRLRFDR